MTLLERLRAEIRLPMRGSYPARTIERDDENGEPETVIAQQFFGWTTDGVKANLAREAGATVTTVRASDPRFGGWEVSVTEIRS